LSLRHLFNNLAGNIRFSEFGRLNVFQRSAFGRDAKQQHGKRTGQQDAGHHSENTSEACNRIEVADQYG
jgi:hypothetical protein